MQTISPMSIAALAAAKHLDPDFLVNVVGLEANRWDREPAVRFPYRAASGALLFHKYRVADGSRNPAGVRLTAYGLERLAGLPDDAILILPEGESDCWCLWQYNFAALGIPGAASLSRIWTDGVAACVGARPLVLWQEPGRGGEELVVAAARVLPSGTRVMRGVEPGEKDPCEVLKTVGSAAFVPAMNERLRRAVPLVQRANEILVARLPEVQCGRGRRIPTGHRVLPPDAVDQARSASTFDWLEARGARFHGTGRNRSARCPFPDHNDSAPSFSVNVETGAWKCWGCDRKGGDAIDLVRQLTGRTFSDAVLELAR